ncbi:MAG: DinB family protein [Bacteroidia bacterium]|nr:DinB family protein [Bacteroidia bacterium]
MRLNDIARNLLADVVYYLEHLSTTQYRHPLPLLSGSSIGQHTRHLMEFFQCLLQQSSDGVIDYDARQRNIRIEEDPAYAASVVQAIMAELSAEKSSQNLYLVVNYALHHDDKHRLATTFERELVYNIEHTIHHLAMIKVGFALIAPEVILPEGFGVAPSTLRYRQGQRAS